MRFLADEWPKALESILVGAIIVFTLLPALGWIWHSVLPEHSHVFLNPSLATAKEVLPDDDRDQNSVSAFTQDSNACTDCATTQLGSGVVHLPSFDGLQIFLVVVASATRLVITRSPDFITRVVFPRILFLSPILPLLDPPPKIAWHPSANIF